MRNTIIIGGGGHAKVVASLLKKHKKLNPIGYLDIMDRGVLNGLPYMGSDDGLPNIISEHKLKYGALGIGLMQNFETRLLTIERIKASGLLLIPIVSPQAIVSDDVRLGDGSVIMDGAIIQPGSVFGDYSILNTGAIVDHDCSVGNMVHIAIGAKISGGVSIGNDVFIGAGSTLIQGVQISANVVIGAGTTVIYNINSPGMYVGTPARRIQRF